jgi:hypothetical protein
LTGSHYQKVQKFAYRHCWTMVCIDSPEWLPYDAPKPPRSDGSSFLPVWFV